MVLAETKLEDDPDSIYVFDPAIVADRGAIVLRSGKEGRLVESAAIATDLERAGVPIAARLVEPQLVDGGDTIWLDEDTLIVGRGYRTNDDGVHALQAALPGVAVLAFDLPHLQSNSFFGPSLFDPRSQHITAGANLRQTTRDLLWFLVLDICQDVCGVTERLLQRVTTLAIG